MCDIIENVYVVRMEMYESHYGIIDFSVVIWVCSFEEILAYDNE